MSWRDHACGGKTDHDMAACGGEITHVVARLIMIWRHTVLDVWIWIEASADGVHNGPNIERYMRVA